jgi:DNA-binding IclR family transcriptional regulator
VCSPDDRVLDLGTSTILKSRRSFGIVEHPSDSKPLVTCRQEISRETGGLVGSPRPTGTPVIQSVDRAIRILLALQGARRLSLTDLATQLGLPNSTVHGLLQTLTAHGMVEQEAGSLRYMLGPAVLRLSSVYLDSLEFRSRTLKWSEELARRTGLAVRAGVLLLGDVIVVHHEPRPDGSRQMPEVGFVMPAHASALGKAILAFRPEETTHLLSMTRLRSMTGETIVDPQTLVDDLAKVSRTGVAAERDEAVLGESSLAAPIFDATGLAVGAVGVVIASSDWPPPDGLHDDLREAARNISRELGAPGWPVYPDAEDPPSAARA